MTAIRRHANYIARQVYKMIFVESESNLSLALWSSALQSIFAIGYYLRTKQFCFSVLDFWHLELVCYARIRLSYHILQM
jgi:hypothetical protein